MTCYHLPHRPVKISCIADPPLQKAIDREDNFEAMTYLNACRMGAYAAANNNTRPHARDLHYMVEDLSAAVDRVEALLIDLGFIKVS